jgi:hypothetical protein
MTGKADRRGMRQARWLAVAQGETLPAVARGRPGTPMNWIAAAGSLKIALIVLASFALGILVHYFELAKSIWILVVPLAAFAVNLSAAVISSPEFRRQPALLVFHLALIAIVVLTGEGRLTSLKGQLELSTGETFDGQLSQVEEGPWHDRHFEQAAFTNDGFTINYSAGVRRDETKNSVSWTAEDGQRQQAIIGDQLPLVLDGYRFYTSSNKGFAPLFTWLPKNGAAQRGTIHLPAYPVHEYRQALDWTLPGTDTRIWVMLQFDEVLLDPSRQWQFRLPTTHELIIRAGEDRRELRSGDRYDLAQGTLVYEGLTTWMGYTVFYDWTLPWLLAACVLAVACLAWHFWKKFSFRPWDA